MAVIRSKHHGPLGLPGGTVVNPGAKVRVDRWSVLREHHVVKAWLDAGVIEVLEDDISPTPAPAKPAFVHPLDHDRDGRKGGSEKQEPTDRLAALRAEYQDVLGKRPFHGWSEDELQARIFEARSE